MIDDFREILDYYNIDYREKFGTVEIDILCPFHDDLHFGNAKYNPTKDTFNCFSCGAGGNRYQFVSRLEGCTLQEAEQLLANDFKEGKKNYNIQTTVNNIERYKTRFFRKASDNSMLLNKTAERMLQTIADKKTTFVFLQQWFPTITFLHSPEAQSLTETEILKIHEDFSQKIWSNS